MTDLFSSGEALVLLDGVDEVHHEQRAQLSQEIEELIRTYPNATYVVTSRPGAVDEGWLGHLNFAEAYVEPMGRRDREEFIQRWFRSAALELRRLRPGEDLAQTGASLMRELRDQPELGVLASNPLLCAMICALYRERQDKLPETPSELCEALTQMLLHRRERETPGLRDLHFYEAWRALQYQQKKSLLADLAWHMVTAGDSAISEQDALAIVGNALASTPGRNAGESHVILQSLVERSGLLRPSGDDRIDYVHNTLKEYLAAGKAVELAEPATLCLRADDPSWQPVILFSLALGSEEFSNHIIGELFGQVSRLQAGRTRGARSNKAREELSQLNRLSFFLVRCRAATKRLKAELSSSIDQLAAALVPPMYMQDVEPLAQLGTRLIVQAGHLFESESWWAAQDARSATRSLRLLRLIGGERAAEIVRTVGPFTSRSSMLTSEWLMACGDLEISNPQWPFSDSSYVYADNPGIGTIEPLSCAPRLTSVSVPRTAVDDLTPIAQRAELEYLSASGTKLRRIDSLASLRALKRLSLSYTAVADISPLRGLTQLREINLAATAITDIQALRDLTLLRELDVSATRVHDLDPLSELTELRELELDDTPVDDLSAIAALENLEHLGLMGTAVRNLRPVENLKGLAYLWMDATAVADISVVAKLKNLQCLSLERTKVNRLEPIANLPKLRTLNVAQTEVSDFGVLTSLRSLRQLTIGAGLWDDLRVLEGMRGLQGLTFKGTELRSLKGLERLSRLHMLRLVGERVPADLDCIRKASSLRHIIVSPRIAASDEFKRFAKKKPSGLFVTTARD